MASRKFRIWAMASSRVCMRCLARDSRSCSAMVRCEPAACSSTRSSGAGGLVASAFLVAIMRGSGKRGSMKG